MMRFGGTLKSAGGAPRVGMVGVTFAIYAQQTGRAPLWQETLNLQADDQGRYSVLLGATRELPREIFSTNEARWLGVQVLEEGQAEQPRVLLVSVPYALKAQDAETLGGRPASAYVLSEALSGLTTAGGTGKRTSDGRAAAKEISPATVYTTSSPTVNALPRFSAVDTLADSMLLETYNQAATDAFGNVLPNEDVLRLGDGTGLAKRLQVAGRLVSEGFDVSTDLFSSVHIVNSNAAGVGLQINALSQTADFTNGIFASAQSGNAIGIQGTVFPPLVASVPGVDYTYSILGVNKNPEGAALFGWSSYNGGAGDTLPTMLGPVGVYASVAHSSGTAAIFDQRSGSGKILSARSGGSEVVAVTAAGNITASGSVTATSFSGSGAGLTGVVASSATTASALASDPAVCAANRFVTDVAADGTLTCTQPSSANLSDVSSLATKTYADAGVSTEAAARAVVDAKLAVRGINYIAGCDSCSLLGTSDSQKAIYMNVVGAMTINQVTCISDMGAPTINLRRNGSAFYILPSDLACSTTGATTTTFTSGESALALNDKLDLYVTGGVGTAHRVTVVIKTTVN